MKGARYVWCYMGAAKAPPTGFDLHKQGGAYRFYPFEHSGNVLTVDAGLWNAVADSKHANLVQWPSVEKLREAASSNAPWLLLATVTTPRAKTIDPSTDVDLQPLPRLPDFKDVGYDVVDRGGLSGLVNVGFGAADLQDQRLKSVAVNASGLIATVQQAEAFAELMNAVAPEHAPFLAVSVLARQRSPGA